MGRGRIDLLADDKLVVEVKAVAARQLRAHGAGRAVPHGQWWISRRDLPLTEDRREVLQARVDRVRETVEDALPSRMARSRARRGRSLADLDAFRGGADLLADMRGSGGSSLSEQAAASLEQALLLLAEAVRHCDRERKRVAVEEARGFLARTVATLLLALGIPLPDPVHRWVHRLECEVIPAVGGFSRWVDRLPRGRP